MAASLVTGWRPTSFGRVELPDAVDPPPVRFLSNNSEGRYLLSLPDRQQVPKLRAFIDFVLQRFGA